MQNNNERRGDSTADVATRLTFLLIGGGIGAVLALLFAPKSGQELRDDIADVTRKGLDRTRETATQLGARAGEYYEATKERASDIYSSATDRAGEVAGTAREAVARKGGQLSAAIEAGKQAYADEKRKMELTGLETGGPNYEGGPQSQKS
ncbi:MAG TPA: YtxH domain-containing protein [Pyrinomonadaceae bacterium]